MTDEALKTERVHCNSCGRKTNHSLIARRVQQGSEVVDGRHEIDWRTTYAMLECCGCETICLRETFWYSEEPETESVTYYPPQVSRRKPKWADDLSQTAKDLLV